MELLVYGERDQTANIHLFVHLADSVLVPLWTHSCFHFEDKNGYLLRYSKFTHANGPCSQTNAVYPCYFENHKAS